MEEIYSSNGDMHGGDYLGHVVYETGRRQSLKEHLDHVVKFSESICPFTELKNIAGLNGLYHDVGKLGEENQQDFEAILKYGEGVHKRNLDHTTAGGRIVYELTKGDIVGELVGIIAFSHHGVQDCVDLETGKTLQEKRKEKKIEYELIQQRFFHIYTKQILEKKFRLASNEFQLMNQKVGDFLKMCKKQGENCGNGYFFMGMYVRLLLSILIDSDWTDSACFSSDNPLPVRLSRDETHQIWKRNVTYFENYLMNQVRKNPSNKSLLNKYRQEISRLCKDAAKERKNLYRLTVPTGAGKTLSSLRFALNRAVEQKKQHIIYVAPFHSILEQNAEEIRKAVESPDIVLEHHCNVIYEDIRKEKEYKKLTEAWDVPIIVTTAVQLLNTLFSDQKSCIRRMHVLCNSVIIFDEVQAIPAKCTELFHLAVNFLSTFCDTAVVLCSATQPTLASGKENNICACTEMAGSFERYADAFKRTEIIDRTQFCPGGMEISDLKDFVLQNAKVARSILVIVNTITCARELYQVIKNSCANDYRLFHLSNNMCAQNKMDKLAEIHKVLENNERVICVSTQLVEAGVNFSFQCVIRSKAGLDNVIQAAGRCNRHKEFGTLGRVYVVEMSKKAENLNHLPEIKCSQAALQKVLDDFKVAPEKFNNVLDSQEAIREYYKNYFAQLRTDEIKFPMKNFNGNLVDLLGKNEIGRKQYQRAHQQKMLKSPFAQAFQTAGKEFEVISDDHKVNIVIPYDEHARQLLTKLEAGNLIPDEQRKMIRLLQRYTVGISETRRNRLSNAIWEICGGVILELGEDYYDDEVGVLDDPRMDFLVI